MPTSFVLAASAPRRSARRVTRSLAALALSLAPRFAPRSSGVGTKLVFSYRNGLSKQSNTRIGNVQTTTRAQLDPKKVSTFTALQHSPPVDKWQALYIGSCPEMEPTTSTPRRFTRRPSPRAVVLALVAVTTTALVVAMYPSAARQPYAATANVTANITAPRLQRQFPCDPAGVSSSFTVARQPTPAACDAFDLTPSPSPPTPCPFLR